MTPDGLVTMSEQMVQDAQSARLTIGTRLLFCAAIHPTLAVRK